MLRIVSLAAVPTGGDPQFGGKATGLSALLALGARVPDGFVIEATTLTLAQWDEATRAAVQAAAAPLLARGPVAVRSSAPGEDGATRSYAGLFESVLDVRSPEELFAALARCLASGAAERVVAYAGSPRPLAVIVQSQLAPRAAGVCFSADPQGRDGAVLVEAVAGLADSLVSGHVQPERWRAYRSGFGGWEGRREDGGVAPVLAPADVYRIAEEARRLADARGIPMDLEWAMEGETVWWVQGRPITAARTPPLLVVQRFAERVDDGPVTVWANWNVRETMPDPLRPLTWCLWRDTILPRTLSDLTGLPASMPGFDQYFIVDLVNGRVYWNINVALGAPFFEKILEPGLAIIDRSSLPVMRRLRAEGLLRPRRMPPVHWPSVPGILRGALTAFAGFFAALRVERVMEELRDMGAAARARPPLPSLDDGALLSEMQLLGDREAVRFTYGMQAITTSMIAYGLASRVFASHPAAERLLAAGVRSPTTLISLDVEALADAALPLKEQFLGSSDAATLLRDLAESEGGRAWRARLDAFLREHGQRGPKEFDLGTPRWAEDPAMIVDLVRATLLSPGRERMNDRLQRVAAERAQAVAAATQEMPFWKRPLARWLAARLITLLPLREAPKHYMMHVFLRMRLACLEAGARLVSKGALEAADDVFFLEPAEIRGLLGGGRADGMAALVASRRRRFEEQRARPAVTCVRSDGVPVADEAPTSNARPGELRGVGVSGGRFSGPVQILRTPDARQQVAGSVLVVELADPGWTPLFPQAGALVMEVGGVMCHAAVVARELGLPAVFGAAGAMRVLHDGQQVVVDGEAGTVCVV